MFHVLFEIDSRVTDGAVSQVRGKSQAPGNPVNHSTGENKWEKSREVRQSSSLSPHRDILIPTSKV